MTTDIADLWSDDDRDAVEVLRRAAADDDLFSGLLAIEGASPSETVKAAGILAELSTEVMSRRDGVDLDASAQIALLASVVAEGFGLAGASDDYYAPENSHITRVLATRQGQPILIASVWILVGQAAGIAIRGVPFPGHFMVTVGGLVVDVFQGGVILSPDELRLIARKAVPDGRFDPSWVLPTSTEVMLARILRNLDHACRARQDAFGAYRARRLLAGMVPKDAPLQLDVAIATEKFGAWDDARQLYLAIMRAFPDSREARVAEVRRMEMQQRERLLH